MLQTPGALLRDFVDLTKARIGVFVVISTLVGFVAGSAGDLDLLRLIHTLFATFLVAAGASALPGAGVDLMQAANTAQSRIATLGPEAGDGVDHAQLPLGNAGTAGK